MAITIKAAGDTWEVRSGERPRNGFVTVLFFCTTTNQRPYRVSEVPEGHVQGGLESLSENDLQELFAASGSLGTRTQT
jgi:hypothetical protein